MDLTVLQKITYGVYIVGAFRDGRAVGCTINTCFQITSENPTFAISLNHANNTLGAIEQNRRFSLSILAENSEASLIGRFGFMSSRDVNKYEPEGYETVENTPCVRGKFAGRLILEAEKFVDCGTHVLVVARLIDTVPGEGTPMTYAYYHQVIKGKAPKTAPTFIEEQPADTKKTALHHFECDLCLYVAETELDALPSDYICPVCGADITHFRQLD